MIKLNSELSLIISAFDDYDFEVTSYYKYKTPRILYLFNYNYNFTQYASTAFRIRVVIKNTTIYVHNVYIHKFNK